MKVGKLHETNCARAREVVDPSSSSLRGRCRRWYRYPRTRVVAETALILFGCTERKSADPSRRLGRGMTWTGDQRFRSGTLVAGRHHGCDRLRQKHQRRQHHQRPILQRHQLQFRSRRATGRQICVLGWRRFACEVGAFARRTIQREGGRANRLRRQSFHRQWLRYF